MMIQLIVTGDAERDGLTSSLATLFPFTASGHPVEFLPTAKVLAATTMPIEAGMPPSSPMKGLARRLVTGARYSSDRRRAAPPDRIIAIDDLELANHLCAAVVVDHVRRAVQEEIARQTRFPDERAELVDKVRERCSFHLLVPMLEAYFFGEPAALQRAGTSAQPLLLSADVEAFETNDPAWLPTCQAENARRANTAPWWKHERHPKHYLEHLVERDGGIYTETRGGVRALRELDWGQTTAIGGAFARALFEDLANSLGVQNPLGAGDTAVETWLTPNTRVDRLTLRNM